MKQSVLFSLMVLGIGNLCSLPAFSQWSSASLSRGRQWITAASAGNKALFAGGYYYASAYNIVSYDGVDIYDDATSQWTTATLSIGRSSMAAASLDSLAFFAGGRIFTNNGSTPASMPSDRVDIYNAKTNQWTTALLSQPRADLVGASAKGKVLFAAGGDNLNVVDIYNIATNQWSVTQLPRLNGNGISATSVGNSVYFAGNGLLDIYDVDTGQWSISTYPQQTYGVAVASIGNKIFLAGGRTNSGDINRVDIYDVASNQWSIATLSQSRRGIATARAGSILFFGGGYASANPSNVLDIYDASANQWSATQFPQVYGPLAATAVGNKAFFVGNGISMIDIYTVSPVSECQSAQSGSWNNSLTWTCGHIPGGLDNVIINAGHIITIPDGDNIAKKVIYKGGKLLFTTNTGKLSIGVN